MQVPRELRWIGPLFLIVYLVLWVSHGFPTIIAIVLHPIVNGFTLPFVVVGGLVLYFVIWPRKRYLFSGIVFFLSLFFSGVMFEPIPVPWTGPYPPLPTALNAYLIALLSPALIPLLIILSPQFFGGLPAFLSLLLLSILPYPTYYVIWSATEKKMDTVHAMLYLVIILLCWTLLVIPLSIDSRVNAILTPVPLGPLVALNILPWIPDRLTEQPESSK